MMKKNAVIKMVFGLCLLAGAAIHAQQPGLNILEKDYEISRKAKKGYLGGVEATTAGGFDMVYFLPSSRRKVKIETYSFDKDANLTNTKKDEWEIEKARKRYKGLTYKGDVLTKKAISVSSNLMGKMVYKNRLVTAKYNWLAGGYVKKVKMLDKQKLANANGDEYIFGGAYEVERDSAILVMGYPMNREKPDMTKLDLMKVANDGTIKNLATIPTGSQVKPIFSRALLDDDSKNIDNDDLPRDWILIMNAAKGSGGNPNEMTYFRISPEGTLKENFKFTAPMAGYRIINAYEKNGSVILYGLGIKKEGKTTEELLGMCVSPSSMDSEEIEQTKTTASTTEKILGKVSGLGGLISSAKKTVNVISGKEEMMPSQDVLENAMDEKKYTDFVICRIAEGKLQFAASTPIEELNQKAVAGPDMKKPLQFDGRKFKTNNFQILNDGSMLLSFQDFKKNSGPSLGTGKFLNTLAGVSTSSTGPKYERVYQGLYMLHFAPDGKLKKNYTVLLDQKNRKGFFNTSPMTADNFEATSYVLQSKDGNSVNWIIEMVKAIDKDVDFDSYTHFDGSSTNVTTTSYSPFYSIEYGKLNLSEGKSSEFHTLGDLEKKKYYLYNKYDRLQIGEFTYFFSETPNGDRLLVSRMNVND
ncbi:hypothetical protein [Kaistella palustris]|uniref:hypothetical protein n=1 Tax=Kaistella palustris TaxID=493376 RepID=UPI0004093395|nr:hypothetical protein [Kaistella palustris]